jgi:hypothetical protein
MTPAGVWGTMGVDHRCGGAEKGIEMQHILWAIFTRFGQLPFVLSVKHSSVWVSVKNNFGNLQVSERQSYRVLVGKNAHEKSTCAPMCTF